MQLLLRGFIFRIIFTGKKEIVQVLTIDDWFKRAGLAKIDVIKLDVEGSELSALKGMNEVLQSFKPIIIVEINPETLGMFGLKPTDIHSYMNKSNFKGFIISEAGKLLKLDEKEIKETVNVLYAHNEKIELLSSLITSY